jgi:hypothetical protein
MLALVALAVAVPPAAAFPDPDGLIATDGPPLPHMLPDGPDGLVRIELKDTDGGAGAGAEAGGNEVEMQARCARSAALPPTSCGGTVCVFHDGYGDLPVYIADPAEGIGAGADVGWIASPDGSDDPSEGPDAQGTSGGYGPYDGVMVSAEGHCGS